MQKSNTLNWIIGDCWLEIMEGYTTIYPNREYAYKKIHTVDKYVFIFIYMYLFSFTFSVLFISFFSPSSANKFDRYVRFGFLLTVLRANYLPCTLAYLCGTYARFLVWYARFFSMLRSLFFYGTPTFFYMVHSAIHVTYMYSQKERG